MYAIRSYYVGHKKGAFTGALADKIGYFESSGTYGTVFLDEIGDTDPLIQVKLLRVLQTRQFQRLGDTRITSYNVCYTKLLRRLVYAMAGLLIGGALPFVFSSYAMKAVGEAAFDMIEEVRRQFIV